MKILVTGAKGYIGNALTQRLLKNGHDVIAIDSGYKELWLKEVDSISAIDVLSHERWIDTLETSYPTFRFIECDIASGPDTFDFKTFKKVFEDNKFDTIVNLAQMQHHIHRLILNIAHLQCIIMFLGT